MKKDTVETVFDRFLLFFEKLFITVKCEVEKLPTQVDTPLPYLWYIHLLQVDDQKNRQNIYEKVVQATEASYDSMSMELLKLIDT